VTERRERAWRGQAWRDRSTRLAAGVLIVLALVALFAPLVATHDPRSGQLDEALQGPSLRHWLGTDSLGRDEFSRLVFGARTSLLAGLEVVAIAALVGVPVGVVAGFRRGWFDRIVMRVVEVAVSLPAILVAIAIVAATGPGVATSMVAIGLVGATIMARLARSVVVAAGGEDYLDGARVVGASDRRIIVRHILPNVAPPLIVQATLLLAAAVLAEAALSFLGLGAVAPAPSWGVMLSQARDDVDDAPWLAVWPGLCIFVTVLAFNRLGDRTRDVLGRAPLAPLRGRAVDPVDPVEPVAGPDIAALPAPPPAAALELCGVTVTFGEAEVVSGVTLRLAAGEVLGLVGESGAGKSTIALAALALVPEPGRTTAASITVAGTEVVGMAPDDLRRLRGRCIGHVAQDPAAALNPSRTVGHQIAEPLRWHLHLSRRQARAVTQDWLSRVGIDPGRAGAYPHQFSGGEAQRVAVAMALACRPAVLVADEVTTALDAVAQAQLLDLLLDLRAELGMAILLISHDLGVVAGVADRVAVMRSGRVVEEQETAALFVAPRAEYTRELLESARSLGAATDLRPVGSASPGAGP
jgi:peptide/nickel transport system permease protein